MIQDKSRESEIIISLSDITMSYGQRTVLSDVSLQLRRGEFLAVTGPNGGGKSTLLKIMLRLLTPTRGTVEYHSRFTPGYLPQKNAIDSRFPITVREVIATGLMGHDSSRLSKDEKKNRVERMIAEMELISHADNPIGALSGGQLQRTLLGRALVGNPPLLVLDEPLSYLDKHFEHELYAILSKFHTSGGTIVLVSHEMTTISNMATRHIMVDRRLIECKSSSHVIHCSCDDCLC